VAVGVVVGVGSGVDTTAVEADGLAGGGLAGGEPQALATTASRPRTITPFERRTRPTSDKSGLRGSRRPATG
jgi:hypothetical protein